MCSPLERKVLRELCGQPVGIVVCRKDWKPGEEREIVTGKRRATLRESLLSSPARPRAARASRSSHLRGR